MIGYVCACIQPCSELKCLTKLVQAFKKWYKNNSIDETVEWLFTCYNSLRLTGDLVPVYSISTVAMTTQLIFKLSQNIQHYVHMHTMTKYGYLLPYKGLFSKRNLFSDVGLNLEFLPQCDPNILCLPLYKIKFFYKIFFATPVQK